MNEKKLEINIFSENIHENLSVDEKKAIDIARDLLNVYLTDKNIFNNSCLLGYDFNCISFDILYCNDEKTHQINKDYRNKDYIADIITFAIFADSEEKFVLDEEINLGEIIISLNRVQANFEKKKLELKEKNSSPSDETQENSVITANEEPTFEKELYFLISHGIIHLLGFDHQTIEDYNFIINAQNSALKKVLG